MWEDKNGNELGRYKICEFIYYNTKKYYHYYEYYYQFEKITHIQMYMKNVENPVRHDIDK